MNGANSNLRNFYAGLVLITVLGLCLRLHFSPDINFETDSFVTLLSAKSIAETGQYTLPPVRLTDLPGEYQSHPGWAVGYPLLLSLLFSLFGYGEAVARWGTIAFCSLVIPAAGMAAKRLSGDRSGWIAAFLVSANPLLICFNGRILTANLGFCFLSLSLLFLLSATVKEAAESRFLTFKELTGSSIRLFYFALSFLFFGLTLATRDDFSMFAFPFFLILAGLFKTSLQKKEAHRRSDMGKLGGIAAFFFLAGWLPNLYYNYFTYGRLLTSSHYEYGGRLSLTYLLEGSRGALGLPGWAVMVFTILVFAFPVVSLLYIRKLPKMASAIAAIFLLMALPIILINGAYSVASSGASPRYVLPLIPFMAILAAIFILQKKAVSKFSRYAFLFLLVLWHALLFYPPPSLFGAFPKTLYLTQYSPWYNRNNFINYPHPIRAMVQWVRMHTPAEAIILSDYDSYHYYFYARRDVMNREKIGEIEKQLRSRPVYFIEDHQSALYPDSLNEWRTQLAKRSIELKAVDHIPLCSPVGGGIRLSIYALTGDGAAQHRSLLQSVKEE